MSSERHGPTRFDGEKFRAWWNGLTAEQQRPFRYKAQWEAMTLPAVIREWWPDVWAAIDCAVPDG